MVRPGLALVVAAALAACKSDTEPKAAPPAPPAATHAADAAPPPAALPPFSVHPTARAALEAMLARVQPRVLGVGEVHVIQGGPAVRSALARFTDDMDVLKGRATDLVVETWVTDGRCGEEEKQATAQVKQDTERPPEVEDELTRLLKKGKELALRPHVLHMTCDHYKSLRADSGEVDYDKLLQLLGSELLATSRKALGARKGKGLVIVYGGSLHNDRAPGEGVAAYSYGVKLAEELGRGYVELDLYVPELIADDAVLRAEPWWPLTEKAGPGQVVLVERGPDSYIMLMQRGVRP
ncbi:MAG TPA: hypothetical protein VMZ28_15410 [Kofleriaceae bacterium]|nr:hypothetical protein [Kofleriaceae bacterium]